MSLKSRKWQFAENEAYGFAMFLAKLSLFLLYLRIFYVVKNMKVMVYCGIIFSFGLYSTNIVLTAVLCAPRVGESWVGSATFKRCTKMLPWSPVQGALNLCLDLYLLALPLPSLWKLNMRRARKIGVMAIFMTGMV